METRKPDGVRLAYAYDRSDKLTAIRAYAAEDTDRTKPLGEEHFWYDGRGLLIQASSRAALVTLERDRNGRIVRETCNGRVVESRLDAMGRRIERRIGAGQAGESLVRLIRDPLGLVARIAVDDHAPLTFRRDALGREVERRSAAGFRLDQSWDAVGQLTGQQAGGRSGHGVGQGTGIGRHYAWDKAGAPTGIDCSATIWMRRRIASFEMLPDVWLLPHLICSRRGCGGGGGDEAGEHGDAG